MLNKALFSEPLGIVLIAIFILAIVASSFRIKDSGFAIASDGLRYYAHLRSLAIDKDLHYLNELRDYNPNNHSVGNLSARTSTGHVPNKYTIGNGKPTCREISAVPNAGVASLSMIKTRPQRSPRHTEGVLAPRRFFAFSVVKNFFTRMNQKLNIFDEVLELGRNKNSI